MTDHRMIAYATAFAAVIAAQFDPNKALDDGHAGAQRLLCTPVACVLLQDLLATLVEESRGPQGGDKATMVNGGDEGPHHDGDVMVGIGDMAGGGMGSGDVEQGMGGGGAKEEEVDEVSATQAEVQLLRWLSRVAVHGSKRHDDVDLEYPPPQEGG